MCLAGNISVHEGVKSLGCRHINGVIVLIRERVE